MTNIKLKFQSILQKKCPNKTKSTKYSRKQFILYGINYLIGYGFIVGMCSAYGNLGLYYLVGLIFCGTIIFSVGLNYAKIAMLFPNSYGAGYLISRKAFGKAGGFINGWLQYIQSPIVAVASVSGIIWSFQNINLFGLDIDKTWLNHYGWILAVASALIFWALTIILTFGFNATKISLYIFSFLKWSFMFLIIFAAIFIIIKNLIHDPDILAKNLTNYVLPKNINFMNIIFGTFTIFFSLGGIEGLATINGDVEDPEKTVPAAIFWTIISTVSFYFFFFIITVLALGPTGPNGILPGSLDPGHGKTNAPNPGAFFVNVLFTGGLAMAINLYLVITQIANKCTNRLQASWMFSRSLISLSANGELPRKLIHVNPKSKQFSRCIWLDFGIGFVLISMYILIFAFDPTHSISSKLDNSFDAISLQISILYFYTAFSIFYCFYKKMITLSKKDLFNLFYSMITIGTLIGCFFVLKIISYVTYRDIGELLSLSFMLVLMSIGAILYFVGNQLGWDKQPFPQSWNKFIADNPDIHIDYMD